MALSLETITKYTKIALLGTAITLSLYSCKNEITKIKEQPKYFTLPIIEIQLPKDITLTNYLTSERMEGKINRQDITKILNTLNKNNSQSEEYFKKGHIFMAVDFNIDNKIYGIEGKIKENKAFIKYNNKFSMLE